MMPKEPLESHSPDNLELGTRTPRNGLALPPKLEKAQLPSYWPYMLPEPKSYFGRRVIGLGKPNGAGWVQGKCPFHDDPATSFHVNPKWELPRWRCFGGCGEGGMVEFHMRMYGLTFPEAVAELLLGVE